MKELQVIAHYSPGYYSILIHDILHGIEDRIIYSIISDKVDKLPRAVKIYYTEETAFFNNYGRRIRLDECIRTNYKLTYEGHEIIDYSPVRGSSR